MGFHCMFADNNDVYSKDVPVETRGNIVLNEQNEFMTESRSAKKNNINNNSTTIANTNIPSK